MLAPVSCWEDKGLGYAIIDRQVLKSLVHASPPMPAAKVAIVRGATPSQMVEKSLELIQAARRVSPDDKVLIKPNYIAAMHPSTGVTTDSRVIEALIRFAKECGVIDITVGEGGSGNTEAAFDTVGIKEITSKHGAKLIDLNSDQRVTVQIPHPLSLREVSIAKTAAQSTCIINVPTLKVHHMALITLCMKNLMGLVLPKGSIHEDLQRRLVDLASIIKPRINIIDGLVGCECEEVYGRPVGMNVIIAGTDIVATDAVGAAAMGIDPETVEHIKLAHERGLGVGRLEGIEILGEPLESVRRNFELPREFKTKLDPLRKRS